MGSLRRIEPVSPFVALLYGSESHYRPLRDRLTRFFGPLQLESPVYPFTYTEYYNASMGRDLKRRFLVFKRPGSPDTLADWKRATNDMEEELAAALRGTHPRPVNIDPGYVTGAKLVLASTKDFAHRIYLRDGIFAEVTLYFQNGDWRSHAFTFPDFRSGDYNTFLNRAREGHLEKTQHEDESGVESMPRDA